MPNVIKITTEELRLIEIWRVLTQEEQMKAEQMMFDITNLKNILISHVDDMQVGSAELRSSMWCLLNWYRLNHYVMTGRQPKWQ